jgi:hypothetical protein
MKRSALLAAAAAVVAALAFAPTSAAEPLCELDNGVCPDTATHQDYEGNYVGHDEPALLFYSNRPGSGNSTTWRLRLPNESPLLPTQDGKGGTWNFQRSLTIWFGMALCETQSYPNPGVPCTANSDANVKDDSNPKSPNWVGNHVGSGFLELQFYPPGWVPLPSGLSCDATRWCAAMRVFGLSDSLTRTNNFDCLVRAGEEWVNQAFITRSGVPQAPPDPLGATAATFTPDPSTALFMNPGDELEVSIHDSPAGLVNSIADLTTGQSGSMTASVANGFAHPLFQPHAKTCTEEPYAFHPMYSTSSEHTRVPWTSHTYNVSFSDEIGHFEYCDRASAEGICDQPPEPAQDGDDFGCFNGDVSLLVRIAGCTASDFDFDGPSYQPDWAGTLASPGQDRQLHAESFVITSPLTGGSNYDRMAFEVNLPNIEFGCNRRSGDGCVNPPPGAQFYPIYSTRASHGVCGWQEGGTLIPGTTNTFGGTSASEYGPLQFVYFASFPNLAEGSLAVDFRNPLSTNPCASTGRLPG